MLKYIMMAGLWYLGAPTIAVIAVFIYYGWRETKE